MSDNSDKTVFKPASPGMRPAPGGRGMDAGTMPRPGGGGGAQRPQQAPPPPQPSSTQVRPAITEADTAFINITRGLNPLVNAAAPLIAVFEKTRGSMSHPNIGGLHKRLINEIRTFENSLRDQGYAPEVVLAARYVICSVLDETVLNTPWGSESAWAQRTLLSVFHNETSGGEKFFLILERMCQSPADNMHMIEFMYICLSLGFEGKYRLSNRGRDAIEQIRDELFAIIRRHRGDYERTLADRWQGLGNSKRTLAEYVPMWVIVAAVACVLLFSFSGFRWWLYKTSTPVATQFSEVTAAAEAEMLEEQENKN